MADCQSDVAGNGGNRDKCYMSDAAGSGANRCANDIINCG